MSYQKILKPNKNHISIYLIGQDSKMYWHNFYCFNCTLVLICMLSSSDSIVINYTGKRYKKSEGTELKVCYIKEYFTMRFVKLRPIHFSKKL